MAFGVVNLGFAERTSVVSVIPSRSRDICCRNSGIAPRVVNRNFCSVGNRLLPTSPFKAVIPSPRGLLVGKSSLIFGRQSWVHSRSLTRTREGLAAGAGGDGDPSDSDSESRDLFEEDGVTEFRFRGDETEVREIGRSIYSVRTLKKLVFKIGDGSKQFVANSVGGVVGIFKKEKQQEPELLAFEASNYESKDGKTALHQWTATELTMQHRQLVRIATDLNYLIFAFAFFGWVRVAEAAVAAFATNPAKLRKLTEASNALDPLTVAWLAYNLRKPILGILQVNPTDFQELAKLKGKLWEELHAFFERQWKVMATLALVRFLGLVANNVPASQWITGKVKALWDVMMMLPIF